MNTKPQFHGSDLEKVEKYYHIPKDQITCFSGNVNPFGLSKTVEDKISKHLDLLSAYPDREYTALRNSIHTYCQVPSQHILVGNGATELISLLIGQLSPKRTLILGPTYSEYSRELSFCDSQISYYHLKYEDQFRLDVSNFLSVLKEGYDLLILCNPNNPTSSVIFQSELKEILSFCKAQHTFVMIDETYVEFCQDFHSITAVPLTDSFDNLIVLRGVSKFFAAPGLRLGYAITSNELIFTRIKDLQIPWSLNSIGAYAGELLFSDAEYITKTNQLITSERTRILKALRSFQQLEVYESYANFFLVRIKKEKVTAFDVFEYCIKKGLMIRDCSSFPHLNGEFIRFCILFPDENTKLLNALRSLFI